MAFLFHKFSEVVKVISKGPKFARKGRQLQLEADMNRLFSCASYNHLGKNASDADADADEIIELSRKTSSVEQQKLVQENIHRQINSFCTYMDETLVLDPNTDDNSSSERKNAPQRSGLGLSVGKVAPLHDNPDDSNREVEPIDSWEEEDEAEAQIDDGGDGGGIVLNNCSWGEKALFIARQVLHQFDVDDMRLYAFKTSPRGYIYVRLDKLSNQYGCPGMDEIESFNRLYKKTLDEIGTTGEIPDDLGLEVSSPGADRLLRVPDDLLRFQDMPMVVRYVEDSDAKCQEKDGVFFLDSIETESNCCVWKLADVKENRDPLAKGRPLSRKRKDWRLKLSYGMIKRVGLYFSY